MSLETHLKYLQEYFDTNEVSEKDILVLFSNYLLNNIKKYENIDLSAKLIPNTLLDDYTNYSDVRNMSEYFPKSVSIQIADILHKLIYIYNQIRLEEDKLYGNK